MGQPPVPDPPVPVVELLEAPPWPVELVVWVPVDVFPPVPVELPPLLQPMKTMKPDTRDPAMKTPTLRMLSP
jgi:hypothetical protein